MTHVVFFKRTVLADRRLRLSVAVEVAITVTVAPVVVAITVVIVPNVHNTEAEEAVSRS